MIDYLLILAVAGSIASIASLVLSILDHFQRSK